MQTVAASLNQSLVIVKSHKVIEENAADASRDPTMSDPKVGVAPGLELGVVGRVVLVARHLLRQVKVFGVGFVEVISGRGVNAPHFIEYSLHLNFVMIFGGKNNYLIVSCTTFQVPTIVRRQYFIIILFQKALTMLN